MKNGLRTLAVLMFVLGVSVPAFATSLVITFDTLTDGDLVTNQFAGTHFINAQVLAAGISLNEFEFPPHSGVNVVTDSGGAIAISFDNALAGFDGFFTYLQPLTLQAFDAGHSLLGTVTTSPLFASNLVLSGDAGSLPNEFLSFSSAAGIASVIITGDALGGSFTLDDATLTSLPPQGPGPTPVPEPGTISLVAIGVGSWVRRRARK